MLKVISLCVLTKYLAGTRQQSDNYDNIFNVVAVGRTFSGSSYSSFNEVTTKFQQQCVSICTYSQICKAFDVTPVANAMIECRFYDFHLDLFLQESGSLEDKSEVKLYSVKIPAKTCEDWYRAGHRYHGAYKVYFG